MQLRCHHTTLSRRSLLGGGAALACGCVMLSGCAANPATGKQSLLGLASINDDIRTGTQAYPEVIAAFGGAYNNDRLQSYVTATGRKIAATTELPDLPYEFTVLNSPIINAFALPGGKIALTRGLMALAGTEAELAGVIAHEAGHVNARHSAQGQTRSTLANIGLAVLGIATGSRELVDLGQAVAGTFLQKYSRNQELEADQLGVRYLARTGYDPAGMASMLASMREQSQVEAEMQGLPPGSVDEFNIMASHPRTIERVRDASAEAAGVTVPNPLIGKAEYLDAINGLMFADDPDQGLVRGRRFLHRGLGFAFEVPTGFQLRNSPENVVAQSRGGGTIVFDMAPVQRARNLIEYLQYEWAPDVRLDGLETIRVNGFAAATGAARLQSDRGISDVRLVAYDAGRGQVYRFLFMSPPQLTRALAPGLRDTTYSFRRLTEADTADLRPLRVIVATVRAGDTVDSLATSLPYGSFNASWFRVLNDLQPGQEVRVGETVKIITS